MNWQTSETTKQCTCRWLERAAAEPHVPIEFNEGMNEYQLVHPSASGAGDGRMPLRYCPFCGCKAPTSRRSSLFAEITNAEFHRLHQLTKGIQTLDDALETLGQPDDDIEGGGGVQKPAAGAQPPTAIFYTRMLCYRSLSDTIDVHIQVPAQGRVQISFAGKYIGGPEPDGSA